MTRPPSPRRRQRSVRLVFAGLVLTLATGFVVGALLLATVAALAVAAVLSVLAGWAAARSLHAELLDTRRQQARERAAQARDAQAMFTERSTQHAAFARFMAERLEARERDVRELHGTLRLSEKRADDAERRVRLERRRADNAEYKVAELQAALVVRSAEDADQLATWEPSAGTELSEIGTVIDLLAWEDRAQGAADQPSVKRHA